MYLASHLVRKGEGMNKRPYILAAEDEPMNRAVIEELLSDDFELTCVENGLECLKSLNKRVPDLILMDVYMPLLGGLDTTREIRTKPEFSSIPIIMVSSLASAKEIEQGKLAGANDYVTKPFTDEQLLTVISQHIY